VIIKSKDLIRFFVSVIESHVTNVFFQLLFGRRLKNGMLPALAGFPSFPSGTHQVGCGGGGGERNTEMRAGVQSFWVKPLAAPDTQRLCD